MPFLTDGGTIKTTIDYLTTIRKQMPFAASLGVNNLAKEAQADTAHRLLPSVFTLRTPWYLSGTRYGFNIKFSKKTDNPIQSILGSAADWLKLQEEGGEKTPTTASSLSLPTDQSQPNKTDVLKKNIRPKALFESGKAFVIKKANGEEVLMIRKGKDKLGKRTGNLRAMYLFKKSGNVRAKLGFVEAETALVNSRYDIVMNQALLRALETAK